MLISKKHTCLSDKMPPKKVKIKKLFSNFAKSHFFSGVDEKYLDGLKNVTVVYCHRRFVGWTDSVGRIVTWSVCGWMDRQGNVPSPPFLPLPLLSLLGPLQAIDLNGAHKTFPL